MKASREQAARNRERVIAVASQLYRAHGYGGIGISGLMKAAGQTHGAFYGQFASKRDLMEEASRHAIREGADNLHALIAGADDPFAALIDHYLSPGHRDRIASGCAFAALASDAARLGPDLRNIFGHGIEERLAIIADALPEDAKGEDDRRQRALALLSALVGAIVLARSVDDELSRAILGATRKALLGARE